MNYRLGFFILAIILGGLVSYMIFKPSEVDNSYLEGQMKQSKQREDSLISELNKTHQTIKLLKDELKDIDTIYSIITKPALIRRADSIYLRHGLN